MTYLFALSKVLPIVLLLLLGVFLNKTQFLLPQSVQDMKKLVINITLPALLFSAFSKVDIQPHYLVLVGVVFAACGLVLLLGRVIQPLTGVTTPFFPSLLTGFEAGMMGYAIFGSVYGIENVYKFGVIDLGQVVFVFFILVTVLENLSSGKKAFRETLIGFVKTPVILAILAGILAQQSGLTLLLEATPLGTSLMDTLALAGSLTTPLVALIIGYELHLKPGNLLKPLMTVGLRMGIWIALGVVINILVVDRILNLDRGFQAAVMTMFILPPPFVIPLFMPGAEPADRDYVVNSLTIATLITLFAFSVVSVVYPG
jgi:predicted permease